VGHERFDKNHHRDDGRHESRPDQRRGRGRGRVVEKALKEALGFSPKGDVRPIGGLPRQEGKAKRVFYKKAGETLRRNY
jgi:phenylacetate-coenzyme A ligase PaaK-like adenylate-forming protein